MQYSFLARITLDGCVHIAPADVHLVSCLAVRDQVNYCGACTKIVFPLQTSIMKNVPS